MMSLALRRRVHLEADSWSLTNGAHIPLGRRSLHRTNVDPDWRIEIEVDAVITE